MKIFLVGTAYPLRGGIAHYVALLYNQLKSMGHEVHIISFKRQYPDFLFKLLFPGKTQHDPSQEIIELPSHALIDSINPISWFKTFRHIKRERPHLVVYKYWMPFFAPAYGTIVLLTKLFTATKSVFIADNVIPHEKTPLIDPLLTKWALWQVDHFIVQSEAVKKDLLQYRPQAKFQQVPHPVFEIFKSHFTTQQARQQLKIQSDEKVILFFGYVREYKGLNYLIEALPIVLKQMKVRLLIAGEFYDDETKYRQLITTLALEPYIILKADYIPNEEVGLYYAAADVVVLPYVSATQSGIIQIAYNYNKPVITTNVGGLPEVIREGETGFIVPAKDVSALAAAIVKFFYLQGNVDFAQYIESHKQQYSWERLAGAIINAVN